MGVVNQAVQDGIGQCRIVDMLDPVFNGDLGRRARGPEGALQGRVRKSNGKSHIIAYDKKRVATC